MHRGKRGLYSITLSAIARSTGGTVRPSFSAVLVGAPYTIGCLCIPMLTRAKRRRISSFASLSINRAVSSARAVSSTCGQTWAGICSFT